MDLRDELLSEFSAQTSEPSEFLYYLEKHLPLVYFGFVSHVTGVKLYTGDPFWPDTVQTELLN